MKRKVIFIGGPTAGGKSALALELAERLGGVIVNADSMQVYVELRVLTARPSAAEEARVPHHLYGHRRGDDPSSAAAWADEALKVLDDAWDAGRIPVVVGGTGLYFRTLIEGIAPVPDIPDAVRQSVRARLADEGPEALHAMLRQHDPELAARLAPGDSQRIARAVEVWEATGRPLSEWQRVPPAGGLRERDDVEIHAFALIPPRHALHERCDRRFLRMVHEGGALDEVAALLALRYDPALPVMKALGVPELAAHIRGEIALETAITRAQAATRQYAKRQCTWFRNQFPDWPQGDAKFLESQIATIFPFIKN